MNTQKLVAVAVGVANLGVIKKLIADKSLIGAASLIAIKCTLEKNSYFYLAKEANEAALASIGRGKKRIKKLRTKRNKKRLIKKRQTLKETLMLNFS